MVAYWFKFLKNQTDKNKSDSQSKLLVNMPIFLSLIDMYAVSSASY